MITHCLLYCIILFSSLIYNEIIIIKFYSMEENTYKYIVLRQKKEFEDINNINEENSSEGDAELSFELPDDGRENEEMESYSDL